MILLAALLLSFQTEADVVETVRRAAVMMRADWNAAPEYAFIEHETFGKPEQRQSKIQQVVFVEGSDYYMPLAYDGQPLSPEQAASEKAKLRAERGRRLNEDASAREKRSGQYRKEREQNGTLLGEFPNAFDFTLDGEETIRGRVALRLTAIPKLSYKPPNRTAKVLTGMRGTLWIDKETQHWVRAEAAVTSSVSIFGFFAHVLPGTKFLLEMTPVNETVWLPSEFDVTLVISKFFFKSTEATETGYSEYRPNSEALEELLR